MTNGRMFLLVVLLLGSGEVNFASRHLRGEDLGSSSSQQIFKRRILPIFQAAKPSSCTECHLSGVDLKQYIRPNQADTFAALRQARLIDVDNPEASKILTFIERAPDDPNPVTQEIREKELSAFRAWILAAVKDSSLLSNEGKPQPAGPTLPVEVIRHARKDRVMASFIDNIWTEVGRCAACHSPDRNQKQVAEHGEEVSWIVLNDPQATLKYMLDADLINPKQPRQSLLLTKPTLQVEHGGGQKMLVGDRSYKQFRRFLDDYAATVRGTYQTADQLPRASDEVSNVTEIWLKLDGIPAKYDKKLLQVDLYRETDAGWSEHRVATSDRAVFGAKGLWQHSLSVTAPRDSAQAKRLSDGKLPPGKYLMRIYIDAADKLQSDPSAELGKDELVGEVEINSRWPAGYGKMTKARFPVD
ncbi:hypothetical protein [Bremerella sp. P1]|uniref:hypothetical protein n=1 Tax=Bremerella sp. P1 TaxID=3026424 RepID=UPI00236794C0|nr:hypothetical protein [Bremerella sp. P1]WDI41522.1 hypothetical protein PSR63_23955 [Bremerella sp. P1]